MPQLCPELTTKLVSLKQLKQEFDLELSGLPQTGKTGDLALVREAKNKLVQGIKELQKSLWPLEYTELTFENFEAQYEFQKNLLLNSGLLKTLTTGGLGIEAIDNKEYPIPTLEQIEEMMLEKREFLKTKIPQGFVKLVLVPLGLPLDSLIKAYGDTLNEHYRQGKLLDTKNKPLELGEESIVGCARYTEAEATGDLVYFPQEYSKTTHQGKTKKQLLLIQAWQVLLIEDLPDLPAEGRSKIKAKRQQQEANQSPNYYLKQLQNDPQYKGEQGLTPESWLIYALSHLTQTNQVIDNYEGSSKGCYLLSVCFKKFGYVSYVYFYRKLAQVIFDQHDPAAGSYSNVSSRSAVSIL
ncbi:MAG: hypothetical protein WCW02_01130 [Candidatus Buchananbacteria bacterium]